MFLLFLLIAAFIWFLSKFSRDFTASIDVEVVYKNTPHGIIVSDKNQNDISFDLTASGFDFLFYKINKPKIYIDLGEYYNHEKSVVLIAPDDFKKIIRDDLVLIQEGVYTFEKVNEAVAEPVVYMIDRYVIGGFYRVHTDRGPDENLNAPGMHFVPLSFEPSCLLPVNKTSRDYDANRFYAYSVIARLALLTAALELEKGENEPIDFVSKTSREKQ